MLYNAKNGRIKFRETDMEYIRFGTGEKILIMLPGLGDGLRTMKGTALPMALLYRMYAKDYRVYIFSRKNELAPGTTTRDMARHLKQAMDALGIRKADLFGVSMGGMIAQHFAADYPQMLGKLILAVTAARSNSVLDASLDEWVSQAKADDHRALMDSNVRLIYSDGYYRRNKWMIPIMGAATKPKSYTRFLIQAEACRNHDAFDRLAAITAPTLVIGGDQDRALGGEASREIAAAIPNASLKMYPNGFHGLYEEEKDFHSVLLAFLNQ